MISITSDQQMVRSAVSDFSVQGRMTQGVKLVRLSEGATLVSVSVCEGEEEAEKAPVSDGVDQPAAPAEGVAELPAENSEAPAPSEGDAEPRE